MLLGHMGHTIWLVIAGCSGVDATEVMSSTFPQMLSASTYRASAEHIVAFSAQLLYPQK